MSPRQRRVLEFVAKFIDKTGFSPTLQEIAIGVGISARSKGAICTILKRLETEGYVERAAPAGRRALRLTAEGRRELVGFRLVDVPTSVLWAEIERRRSAELGSIAHG
jgi:SOS-response transcriptional repressor LexA